MSEHETVLRLAMCVFSAILAVVLAGFGLAVAVSEPARKTIPPLG